MFGHAFSLAVVVRTRELFWNNIERMLESSSLQKKKAAKKHFVWHRTERGLEKEKEEVTFLCSWWLCLVLHSPLLLLWGPEKCRNVTECWKVPVRKKKAKRNIVWHRAQRGLERNFCPASAMSVSVVRASSNLIVNTWISLICYIHGFVNIDTWISLSCYMDLSKLF